MNRGKQETKTKTSDFAFFAFWRNRRFHGFTTLLGCLIYSGPDPQSPLGRYGLYLCVVSLAFNHLTTICELESLKAEKEAETWKSES